MGFFNNQKNVKAVKSNDFGPYLNLVESIIFEVERSLCTWNAIRSRNERRQFRTFLLLLISGVLCPVFLLSLCFLTKKYILVEMLVYISWLLIGSIFLLKFLKNIFFLRKYSKNVVNQIFPFFLFYGLDVLNAFFSKSGTINISKKINIEKKELLTILAHLEIEISIFEDVVYKNNHLNEDPLIMDNNNHERREFSHLYLRKYINSILLNQPWA